MPNAATCHDAPPDRIHASIEYAIVMANVDLCRAHARLTLRVGGFSRAQPGQFVQLSPAPVIDERVGMSAVDGTVGMPLLPRAFSIGGLRPTPDGCEIDVVYRVVGIATNWMYGLQPGERATVLGPLGREFTIPADRQTALLVIGGVGLPPLLYLAEALTRAGKRTIAFIGAQSGDLVPLDLNTCDTGPARDAAQAVSCTREFADLRIPSIISTDDGSLGFQGTIVAALDAYSRANAIDPADTIVYTCGPERMMQATAEWCARTGVRCQVCMERPMACGMGTCQSCIVTVRSDAYAGGTRYALCCSEGPVFDAEQVVWE